MIGSGAKGVLVALLSGILCLAAQTRSQSPPGLTALLTQAQQAQQRGDYRAAAEAYAAILKVHPNILEARINLGLMDYVSGNYQGAARNFEIVQKKNPDLYVANLFLGLARLRLGRAAQALPYLQRAYRDNGKDSQLLLGLAACFETLGNFPTAVTWYTRAIRMNSKNPDAWYGLGMAYLRQQGMAVRQLGRMGKNSAYARTLVAQSLLERGYAADAAKILQEVLTSPSHPASLRATLGFAYLKQKELKRAQHEFSAEISQRPGCLLAWLGQARVFLEEDAPSSAHRNLQKVWDADPNFLSANFYLFAEGLDAGKLQELERLPDDLPKNGDNPALDRFLQAAASLLRKDFDEALPVRAADQGGAAPGKGRARENPTQLYAQGHYTRCAQTLGARWTRLQPMEVEHLCECSYYSGDYTTAFSAGERLARLHPDNLSGLYWKARAAQKLAVHSLVQAGLAAPDSPRVHLLLAELYLSRQQTKPAEGEFQKVIKLQPQNMAARLGLAASYEMDLRYDEAVPDLKQVLSSDPFQPEANYLMGVALVQEHLYLEAIPHLRAALQGKNSHAATIHAMLAKVASEQGQLQRAVSELNMALPGDQDGSFHYQLYILYKKLGDRKSAAAALAKSQAIRNRELQARQALIVGSLGDRKASSSGNKARIASPISNLPDR